MTQKTQNAVTSFRVVVDEKATVTAIRPVLDDGSEPAPSLMLPKVPARQAETIANRPLPKISFGSPNGSRNAAA